MPVPSNEHLTLKNISVSWAFGQNPTLKPDDILEILVQALWKGDLPNDALRWHERGALSNMKKLKEFEEPPEEITDFNADIDSPRSEHVVRDAIFTMLCFDEDAAAFKQSELAKNENQALRFMAALNIDRYTEREKEILRNVTLTEDGLIDWCQRRGWEPPRFCSEQSPALGTGGGQAFATVYMEYMTEIAKGLGLEKDKAIPKKNLIEELTNNWDEKRLGLISDRQIGAMATFLRQPKDKIGGPFTKDRSNKG